MNTIEIPEHLLQYDWYLSHLAWLGLPVQAPPRRATLRKQTFSQANLDGANLTGADLSMAILIDAGLTGANLQDADMNGANLRCSSLRKANLTDANLRGASLDWADLSRANLSGVDLRDARLHMANGEFVTGYFGIHFAVAAGGYISIGCERHSYEYWLKNYRTVGEKNDYTPEQIETYGGWIKLAVKSLSRPQP